MYKATLQFAAFLFATPMLAPLAMAQQTAAPMITPSAGTYAAGQLVTITDATPGAVIYYGDHGVIPTTTKGTRYTGPFLMTSVYDTVNAIAIAPGMTQSAVVQVRYMVPPPPAATPVFVQPAGIYPYGQLITITDSTPGATIYIGVHGVIPTTRGTKYTGPFAVSSIETVQAMAVAPGYGQSAIAVAKYTALPNAATPVVTPASGSYAYNQRITITDSTPGARVFYTIDGSTPGASSPIYSGPFPIRGPISLRAIALQPEYAPSLEVDGEYSLRTAAPVFSPASGTLLPFYSVTIADSTAGTSIYYTTDGSTPTTASTLYNAYTPISVTTSETLKAIAVAPGYPASVVSSASFSVTAPSQVINAVAGNGTAGYTGDGGPAINATLNLPQGLALDKDGNLYIADTGNNVIRKISTSGVITTFAGNGTAAYSGDGGLAASASLHEPNDVAVDSKGNLYIADGRNWSVRKVDASTGKISTYAGTGMNGIYEYGSVSGVATDVNLGHPVSIAVDANDDVWIGDDENNRIFKVEATTGFLTTGVGNGGIGHVTNGESSLGPVFEYTYGLKFNPAGFLYVANTYDFEVDRVDTTANKIFAAAGHWSAGEGTSGDGGQATDASLCLPYQIAFDANSNLYIADYCLNTIRQVSAETGIILTVAGQSQIVAPAPSYGYSGDGGLATKALLNGPKGIIVALDGTVFVADSNNHAIRKITGIANSAKTR